MLFTVEELALNESFIQYCVEQDAKATAYWNKYLEQHPDQLPAVQEAKALVLGLKRMFKEKHSELEAFEKRELIKPLTSLGNGQELRSEKKVAKATSILRKWTVAASIFIVLSVGIALILSRQESKTNPILVEAAEKAISKSGEIKILLLSDGTKVTINAESELQCSDNFGVKDRNVYLKGEALFDVAHNKKLPFIVHLNQYKVKAVGTKFNIKEYPNDTFSETALLEGKVQILSNKTEGEVVLKTLNINEKIVVNNPVKVNTSDVIDAKVVPLLYDELKRNVETAWVNDDLIFEDQTLDEIKNVLERKFDVVIVIDNESLRKYKYSAAFRDEKIDEILNALQLSYPFTYQIKKKN